MPPDPSGRRSPTTLHQIAAAAEVSLTTVSNVVHGRFHLMRPDTRARVESVIERLGYRPHITGRGLRWAQSFFIGMLVVDESADFLVDSFTTQVIAGLSNYLGARGYGLTLHGVQPENFEKSIFISDARTDGLCVFLCGTTKQRARMIERLSQMNEPIVLLQECVDRRLKDICLIRQDDAAGSAALAKHLVERGARNLLMLQPKVEWSAVHERERGLRAALGASRIKTHLSILKCDHMDFVKTQETFGHYIEGKGLPDAIVASNDQTGIAIMKYLLDRGIDVPGDVLLTGFNGFDFWQYSSPILTTVRSPAYELGTRGGAEIVKRLETGRFAVKSIVLPVELRVGETTMRAPPKEYAVPAKIFP